jgi:hypothetical protein
MDIEVIPLGEVERMLRLKPGAAGATATGPKRSPGSRS